MTTAAWDRNAASRIGCTCWSNNQASNAALPTMAQCGARWVRSTWSLHFDLIASAPGKFDFGGGNGQASIDRILELGMSVMGLLDGRWGHEMGVNTAPWSNPIWRHLDYWEEFVCAAVEHYRGKVRVWEVLNEPPFFWWYPVADGVQLPKHDPPLKRAPIWAYADLLKATSRAIRRSDPQAVIVAGSTFSEGYFLRKLYQMGCRDFFDVVGVHYVSCKHPEDFGRAMRCLRSVMAEFGDADKPIWDTENGPGGAVIGNAVETPAQYEALYNVYRHCFAFEHGMERYFWFNPVAFGETKMLDTHTPEGQFTPPYRALQTLHNAAGESPLLASRHFDSEVHAYVFQGVREPVSVLWSTAPATASLRGGYDALSHLGDPAHVRGEVALCGRPLLIHGDVLTDGMDAHVHGPRETVVAVMESKRAAPDTLRITSTPVATPLSADDPRWASLPFVARRNEVPVTKSLPHFVQVSSSVAADLQLAHDDQHLYLRVRTYDGQLDSKSPTGLVQFTIRDENPTVREWSFFYNSYAIFNLFASPRGCMLLRFDPMFVDEFPAGPVCTAKTSVRALADGLEFFARVPWEELGRCRPGQHNPFLMMFGFARADGLLDAPAGDTPEEWSHNFNDTFIIKPPAVTRWIDFHATSIPS